MLMGTNNIRHVAIIMDGNGRWAQGRGHVRIWGHVRGSSVVSSIVEEAQANNLEALTLYAFSTENWSRPFSEVKVLFRLLKKFLLKERKKILQNKIRFKVIGDTADLPEETKCLIDSLTQETSNFKGLKLTFAFGYGGRSEILHSVNKFITDNPGVKLGEKDLWQNLFAPELPEVDLLIRTGGDQRVSNFLLWQIAYAELFFTKTQWPEFKREEFCQILDFVSNRERRFGATTSYSCLNETKVLAEKNRQIIHDHLGTI